MSDGDVCGPMRTRRTGGAVRIPPRRLDVVGAVAVAGGVAGPGAGGVVSRPGLFGRLGGSARVTVVSAPPGSGKTVLLRSWIGQAGLAGTGGLLIAVAGRMSADDARALAAARRGNAPALALLLAVSAWASDGIAEDTARTAEILSAAGWRVAVASASTPLAAAWQQLCRPVSPSLPFEPADRPLGVR
jgi:hypothetical protein